MTTLCIHGSYIQGGLFHMQQAAFLKGGLLKKTSLRFLIKTVVLACQKGQFTIFNQKCVLTCQKGQFTILIQTVVLACKKGHTTFNQNCCTGLSKMRFMIFWFRYNSMRPNNSYWLTKADI